MYSYKTVKTWQYWAVTFAVIPAHNVRMQLAACLVMTPSQNKTEVGTMPHDYKCKNYERYAIMPRFLQCGSNCISEMISATPMLPLLLPVVLQKR